MKMTLEIPKAEVAPDPELVDLQEQLAKIVSDLDQPVWMCSKKQLTSWSIKKLHILNDIKQLIEVLDNKKS